MNLKSVLIVLTVLLLPFGGIGSQKMNKGIREKDITLLADFKSVKKFDTHIHINTGETVHLSN